MSGLQGEPRPALPRPVAVAPNATRMPWLRRGLVTGVVVTLFMLCALLISSVVTDTAGVSGALLGALTASTAIGIVVPVFLWVDRMESEPARLMWFAFLWGALVSTAGALVLNQLGMAFFAGLHLDPVLTGAVFVAPLVEECLKCLGVLLIFLFARREFNGIVDGIAYAGIVAAGFAFVENIIYLSVNYVEYGTSGLVGVFIMRCLASPFAHPLFTVWFGVGLGVIAYRRTWSRAVVPVLGFAVGVFLHALWNFAAVSSSMEGFLTLYLLVQVPLFVGFVVLLVWARRRETRLLREYLTGYGINGWFTPAEVAMLTSPRERRRARGWARSTGGRRAQQGMEAFQDDATELAVVRRHIERGDTHPFWVHRERQLLDVVQQARATFVTPGTVGTSSGPLGTPLAGPPLPINGPPGGPHRH